MGYWGMDTKNRWKICKIVSIAIMSVGATLSLQIRNNSIIITANKLFCRNFCSRVRKVSNREHGNDFYNKLTGTCKPAAIIH